MDNDFIEKNSIPIPESGCWLWLGRKRPNGYGGLDKKDRLGKRIQLAHRYSWYIYNGEIPENMLVQQKCKQQLCVNPEHLYLCLQNELETPIERFNEKWKLNENNGCWEWTHSTRGKGYAQFSIDGIAFAASHFSYKYYKGEIPNDMFVCHKCDNPKCVNPNHLFLGTNSDNMQDMIRKGRNGKGYKSPLRSGELHPKAKLFNSDVIKIRELYKAGKTRKELSNKFNVSYETINLIVNNKTWTSIK